MINKKCLPLYIEVPERILLEFMDIHLDEDRNEEYENFSMHHTFIFNKKECHFGTWYTLDSKGFYICYTIKFRDIDFGKYFYSNLGQKKKLEQEHKGLKIENNSSGKNETVFRIMYWTRDVDEIMDLNYIRFVLESIIIYINQNILPELKQEKVIELTKEEEMKYKAEIKTKWLLSKKEELNKKYKK